MALHNLNNYTGTTPPTDVTTKLWDIDWPDGATSPNNTNGILTRPTNTGGQYRAIMFVRGGFDGNNNALTDTIVGDLENAVLWNDDTPSPGQEDAANGYIISACAIRGINAAATSGGWTGQLAVPGDDEMGGGDLDDLEYTYAAMHEFTGTVDMTNITKSGIWAYSSGCLRACKLMAEGRANPAAMVMRAPLVDIYGTWDDILSTAGASAALLTAMIPNWESADGTSFDKLKAHEQRELWKRSPAQWANRMPEGTKYLLIGAERDTTAYPEGTKRFADALRAAGRDVTYVNIPTAVHGFTDADTNALSLLMTRKFFGRHLK